MGKIVVLGIGNQLMMDDGLGIYLVEKLAKLDEKSDIQYVMGESDIDYCLNQLEGADFVIILDAISSGKKAGDITIFPLSSLHEYYTLNISPHNLHLFQALYQQKATIKGYLIGVEPKEISFHIGLSKTLREMWDNILLKVRSKINELLEER